MRIEPPLRAPRVLQILACDDTGGTENMVCAQVLGRHPDRVYYEVATLAPPGPVASRLRAAGVEVHSLGAAGPARQLSRLLHVTRRGRFDIVNAYGFRAALLARAAVHLPVNRGPRPRLVNGVRGLRTTEVEALTSSKARVVELVEKATRGMVDVWDANSDGAAAYVRELGVPSARVRCIPNGLDLRSWPAPNGQLPADPAVIVCVSRFVPRKRHVDLLLALARLHQAGIRFRAELIGDGPTRQSIEELAASLGIAHAVRFHRTLGPEAVAEVLRTATLFCLPSAWEGMPGAVMEAMAAGLPVVATDVNGTDMLVVDRVTGRLVPPRSPERLAEALEECLARPELMREMGRAARDRIEREFSLEQMIERKERLYAELAPLPR